MISLPASDIKFHGKSFSAWDLLMGVAPKVWPATAQGMQPVAWSRGQNENDTAENEQHLAENLQKSGNYPSGPVPYDSADAIPGLPCAPGRAAECAVSGQG